MDGKWEGVGGIPCRESRNRSTRPRCPPPLAPPRGNGPSATGRARTRPQLPKIHLVVGYSTSRTWVNSQIKAPGQQHGQQSAVKLPKLDYERSGSRCQVGRRAAGGEGRQARAPRAPGRAACSPGHFLPEVTKLLGTETNTWGRGELSCTAKPWPHARTDRGVTQNIPLVPRKET